MNLLGRIQGQLDSPLTEEGIRKAKLWGRSLMRYNWQLILSSDLGRAKHTSELINESLNLPIKIIPELKEQAWGRWSGLTLDEIHRTDKEYLDLWDFENDWNYSPPDGESRNEVIERSTGALKNFVERNFNSDNPLNGNILVVTHAGVMRFIFLKLLGKNFSPENIDYLRPDCINWLILKNGNFQFGKLNEPI
jgi:probable phosphoglycerate mutase